MRLEAIRTSLLITIGTVMLCMMACFCFAGPLMDEPHDASFGAGCISCHDMTAYDQPNLIPDTGPPLDIDDCNNNRICAGCHEGVTATDARCHSSLTTSDKYGTWRVGCSVCHNQHAQEQDRDFGTTYGKFVRRQISLAKILDNAPPFGVTLDGKSGRREVSFVGPTGNNSFVDNDETIDGICQVCHTRTNHFRNTGEINVTDNGYDHTGTVGTDCMQCHDHSNGFSHGGGSGTECVDCHGHDAGTLFDPDMTSPYTPGEGISQGRGTFQSHSTHTETDADDLKGPGLYCADCHDISDFPFFNSGTDADSDDKYNLAETDVCNGCHSSGGSYDGINDPVVGAKSIWHDGSYMATDDSTLQPGREKWCATCHDEEPSLISGVSAPNVIGDEDGDYIYGTGWGFYKTGHGLEAGEQYPSKGGIETFSGRPVECDSCHDYATAHIDGESRTYDDGDVKGLDPAFYRQGYRLKMIGGQEPMQIPKKTNTGNTAEHYRVCFQTGCHSFGPAFTDTENMDTNMVTDGINRHAYHLKFNNDGIFAGDWSGAKNSRMTCISCHNVHGSIQLAMIRDGKFIGKEPGQRIWYKNDAITYLAPISTNSPVPEDLPLSASDGKAWDSGSSVNLCAHCHPSNNFVGTNDRTPYQDVAQAPILSWTGTSGLEDDGVAPNNGAGNSIFTFRVAYSDINNDSPDPIQVWVDLDDSGTYEEGEKFAMTGPDTLDTNIVDGKIYSKSLAIGKAGDNVLSYRFYAYDGGLEATGDPTSDNTLTILLNQPVLSWTGEDLYQADGVNPDTGGNGADFTFRVLYRDADGDCPSAADAVQVTIDGSTYNMSEVDGGDSNCADGKLYSYTTTLSTVGTLNYSFSATDADGISASGEPISDHVVTVLATPNNPPFLEWVDGYCRTEGVKPSYGAIGADFEFYVSYTDPDGGCPSAADAVQVTVDGSTYDMAAVDGGDNDCSDGKLYSYPATLNTAGLLNYSFSATDDDGDSAYGEPIAVHVVEVVDTIKVKPGGSGDWYSSIQSAIEAVSPGQTILVYDGTYNETIELEDPQDDITISSVCGPDTTIITGTGSGSTVIFNRYSRRNVLDGFQVTGGETGISILGTEATINNCLVHDNNRTTGDSAAGINVIQNGSNPTLTLTNSEIYDNTSDRGAGVKIWRGTGHVIDNSIIRNNTATGDSMADGGGGLHIFQIGEATISNSIIENNESVNYSGGGLYVNQVPDNYSSDGGLTIEDSIIRHNTTNKVGGGVINGQSKIYFIRSSIIGNLAEDEGGFPYTGGGAYSQPSEMAYALFENCIVAENRSKQGGMAYLNAGDLEIINSTIADNEATLVTGGAIYTNPNDDPANITIRNSILWGNRAATHGHIGTFANGPVTITDSVIQNGDDGDFINEPYFAGGFTPTVSGFASEDDPWFFGDGNYHIQAFSPAVDNADEAYAPALDIDGQSRPQGATDDIGADEFYP